MLLLKKILMIILTAEMEEALEGDFCLFLVLVS